MASRTPELIPRSSRVGTVTPSRVTITNYTELPSNGHHFAESGKIKLKEKTESKFTEEVSMKSDDGGYSSEQTYNKKHQINKSKSKDTGYGSYILWAIFIFIFVFIIVMIVFWSVSPDCVTSNSDNETTETDSLKVVLYSFLIALFILFIIGIFAYALRK
jgi:hypothetical protein